MIIWTFLELANFVFVQILKFDFFVEIPFPLERIRNLNEKIKLENLHKNKIRELQKKFKSWNFGQITILFSINLVNCIHFQANTIFTFTTFKIKNICVYDSIQCFQKIDDHNETR